MVQKIIENGGRGWFKSMDETLVRCLAEAWEDGRRLAGGSVKRWQYGEYNELTIKQPVGGEFPFLRSFFNIGPVPMSGSSTTVKQTTRQLGPSMRFVADLSNWDGSLNNLTNRRIGTDPVEALQGPVECLLCGDELSDAV